MTAMWGYRLNNIENDQPKMKVWQGVTVTQFWTSYVLKTVMLYQVYEVGDEK